MERLIASIFQRSFAHLSFRSVTHQSVTTSRLSDRSTGQEKGLTVHKGTVVNALLILASFEIFCWCKRLTSAVVASGPAQIVAKIELQPSPKYRNKCQTLWFALPIKFSGLLVFFDALFCTALCLTVLFLHRPCNRKAAGLRTSHHMSS